MTSTITIATTTTTTTTSTTSTTTSTSTTTMSNTLIIGPKGAKVDPSYREVCTGETGHVEVFYLEYEGGEVVYEELCRFLFQFTDPTTLNRQGGDIGTQYANVIYCYDQKQMEIAKKVLIEAQELLDKGLITTYENKKISTDIREATIFYPAHEEHQLYLEKNPNGYCNHRLRIKEWPSKN